jgi:alpha-tubulin suppressor-like RCC1 family protein
LSDVIHRSSPTQIGTSTWTSVDGGASNTASIGIDSAYGLYVWGNNPNGQIGDSSIVAKSSPVFLYTPLGQSWNQVNAQNAIAATQLRSTGAIRNDGTLYTWGSNNIGQLGTNDILNRSQPTQISTSKSWTLVSVGGTFTTGILSGYTYSWGDDSVGQLNIPNAGPTGTGTWLINRSSPTQISSDNFSNSPIQIGSSVWTSVSSGSKHAIAIRSDSTLWAWGLNAQGQLGTDDAINRSSPVQIASASWTSVSGGASHSLAINSSGILFGWGQIFGGSGNYLT